MNSQLLIYLILFKVLYLIAGCGELSSEPGQTAMSIALGTGFLKDSVRVVFLSSTIFDRSATTDSTGYAWISGNQTAWAANNGIRVFIFKDSIQVYKEITIKNPSTVTINYIRNQKLVDFQVSTGLLNPKN